MKLQIYNRKDLLKGKNTNPCISITPKGLWTINVSACRAINFEPGTQISIVQDIDSPRDFYLMRDPNGIKLREKKDFLEFNSKKMREILIDALRVDAQKVKTIKFIVATQPVQHEDKIMYAILTSRMI